MEKFSGESERMEKSLIQLQVNKVQKLRLASTKDVNEAVQNAKKAFESWSNKPPLQRARVMFKFKELIEKNSDELTKIIVSEHGKVYDDAKGSLSKRFRSRRIRMWYTSNVKRRIYRKCGIKC